MFTLYLTNLSPIFPRKYSRVYYTSDTFRKITLEDNTTITYTGDPMIFTEGHDNEEFPEKLYTRREQRQNDGSIYIYIYLNLLTAVYNIFRNRQLDGAACK